MTLKMTPITFNKSIIRLNEFVSLDMKNLAHWLNANDISLNAQKTDLIIPKQEKKTIPHNL